jgi:phospholipase A1
MISPAKLRILAVLLLAAACLSTAATAPAQDGKPPLPTRVLKEPFAPNFTTYLPTYLGYIVGHSDDYKEGDLKFQFSFKYELLNNKGYYFAYTQKSFWAIGEESEPFRESNFAPELFWQWKKSGLDWLPVVQLSPYRHESTGEAEGGSHGWDITYAELTIRLGNFFLTPRLWVPTIFEGFDEKSAAPDNSDIFRYYGYGNLTLSYQHGTPGAQGVKPFKHDLVLSFAPRNDKISVEYSLNVPLGLIFRDIAPYLLLQVRDGYGGNLKDYNRKTTSFVVGISLVP